MPHEALTCAAVDIILRARREQCEYSALFRANPTSMRARTAEFYVDHALLIVSFRSREPDAGAGGVPVDDGPLQGVALDGIGVDRKFLVMRHDGDESAMYAELARSALAWWFDEFEQDADPVTLANAQLIRVVVEAALALSEHPSFLNQTSQERLVNWREFRISKSTPPPALDQ